MRDLRQCGRCVGACLTYLAVAALSATVSAQIKVVPNLTLDAPGLGVAVTHTPDQAAFKLAADGKSYELITPGSIHVPGAPWLTVRELRFDPDPLVYGNILVQNTTANIQTYTATFTLPTTLAAPNWIRGSIDTSIIGTDGKISAVANSAIYSAQIDGTTVHTLQDYPFSLSTPQSAVSSSAAFGFDPSAVAVSSTIGIVLRFDLSPGDTAAIISDFEVVVPEPGSVALFGFGALALVVFRRRG